MNTPFDAFPAHAGKFVYVRPVAVSDLPDDLREEAGDLDVIYSVHAADGKQIALVANRALAFHLARQHDVTPVSVH
ncbi:MAG: DUF1150 family protein [Paracoccaceae bacterium]